MRLQRSEMEFINCISELAKAGRFEGASLGIAKQVITSGEASLNERQRGIFHASLDKMIVEKCPVCNRAVPWLEMPYAIEKGTCPACRPKNSN